MLKKHHLILAAAAILAAVTSCTEKRPVVVFETTKGDITFELFNETPLHRDNFLSLVDSGAYDGILFHRVIRNFMIQCGDPNSKNAAPGEFLGDGDLDYTVPAEFRLEQGLWHRHGMLSSAREGDDVNPQRASSAMQFTFVWGRIYNKEELDRVQERLDRETGGTVKLTEEMRRDYCTVGGNPHLDGQYTVFGQVLSGMEVVDAIQRVETDGNDRPLEDVRILRAYRR